MKCRICKCTEERACSNGCGWAEGDLCTNCAELVEALSEYREVVYRFNLTGIMRELNDPRRLEGRLSQLKKAMARGRL